MAPRRTPSNASVAPSRAASPPPADDEETVYFDSIDELQQHGINVQDITKLKAAAINTVSGVVMTTRRQMMKIKGMSEAKVDKVKVRRVAESCISHSVYSRLRMPRARSW
ncbi:hypothetical protein C8F01DRAFT_346778 [Mycena amicta]|nr:hypothetical protein C8F01DRAFT_346778 [Mycena amicta]